MDGWLDGWIDLDFLGWVEDNTVSVLLKWSQIFTHPCTPKVLRLDSDGWSISSVVVLMCRCRRPFSFCCLWGCCFAFLLYSCLFICPFVCLFVCLFFLLFLVHCKFWCSLASDYALDCCNQLMWDNQSINQSINQCSSWINEGIRFLLQLNGISSGHWHKTTTLTILFFRLP